MREFVRNPVLIIFIMVMAWQSYSSFESIGSWFYVKMLMLPGIIIGLSLHEYAHAKVASMLGDDTPVLQGRVTLNPMAHIDILGFFSILLIGFGWGKPVYVNPYNFKKKRRDDFLVSIAGVAMNFIVAVVFFLILFLIVKFGAKHFGHMAFADELLDVVQYTIWINLALMLFNLLPVPPLDGFGLLTAAFNLETKSWYNMLYRNGSTILLLLIIFDVTDIIISPLIKGIYGVGYGAIMLALI